MIATYEPADKGRMLNVRERPAYAAPVVRRMGPGSEECAEVVRGWCRLDDGWADASFLTVSEGVPEEAGEPNGADAPAAPEDAADGDPGGELRKMSVKELHALAEGSGISVPKSATKEAIVNAILAG